MEYAVHYPRIDPKKWDDNSVFRLLRREVRSAAAKHPRYNMQLQTTTPRTKHDPTDAPQAEETQPTLSKDELFEILKNQRRRDALRYLNANDGVAKLSDLSEHIAAKENGIEISALSSSQRKRVYIGLYQCHLPKMATFGVIDFDKNRGTIELRPMASLFDKYLNEAISEDTADSTPRVAFAVAVAVVVAAGLLGVPFLSTLPAVGWAVVSTVALLALAGSEALGY